MPRAVLPLSPSGRVCSACNRSSGLSAASTSLVSVPESAAAVAAAAVDDATPRGGTDRRAEMASVPAGGLVGV